MDISDYSRKISERLWNLPDKGERESLREATFIDDIVQKSHIERELLTHLHGIETAFDGGGGCGRFSILLASHGVKVTHYDISTVMIDKAKELADRAGVMQNIEFVHGALEELSGYADRSFDLVMSFDAPISYTYPNQQSVIRNLVRMAKKRVTVSVSSRLGSLPYPANPLNKNQFILDENSDDPWVKWCLESMESLIQDYRFNGQVCREMWNTGLFGDGSEEIAAYDRGEAPWAITYTFMPDELERILSDAGLTNIRLAGPGAYARTLPNAILVKIMNDPAQREDFLSLCHQFDSNPYVCGLGKDNLFASGEVQ